MKSLQKQKRMQSAIILLLFVCFIWIVEFDCNVSISTDSCHEFVLVNNPDPPQESQQTSRVSLFSLYSETASSTVSPSPSFPPDGSEGFY